LVGSRVALSNGGGGAGEEGAQSFRHGGEVVQFFRTAKAIQEVGVWRLYFCCSRVLWSCRQGSSLISRFLNSSYLENVYAKKDALRSLDKTFVLPKPVNFPYLSETLTL
jgi:hypothetical protein